MFTKHIDLFASIYADSSCLYWGVGTGLSRTFRSKKSKKQCLAQGNHGYGIVEVSTAGGFQAF